MQAETFDSWGNFLGGFLPITILKVKPFTILIHLISIKVPAQS